MPAGKLVLKMAKKGQRPRPGKLPKTKMTRMMTLPLLCKITTPT